jgi:hypothetical protein
MAMSLVYHMILPPDISFTDLRTVINPTPRNPLSGPNVHLVSTNLPQIAEGRKVLLPRDFARLASESYTLLSLIIQDSGLNLRRIRYKFIEMLDGLNRDVY